MKGFELINPLINLLYRNHHLLQGSLSQADIQNDQEIHKMVLDSLKQVSKLGIWMD